MHRVLRTSAIVGSGLDLEQGLWQPQLLLVEVNCIVKELYRGFDIEFDIEFQVRLL